MSAAITTMCSRTFPSTGRRSTSAAWLAPPKLAEQVFIRADGSTNIIRWEVRPWHLDDGSIGGIMMLTEEISERKKLEHQLWRLASLTA